MRAWIAHPGGLGLPRPLATDLQHIAEHGDDLLSQRDLVGGLMGGDVLLRLTHHLQVRPRGGGEGEDTRRMRWAEIGRKSGRGSGGGGEEMWCAGWIG